MQDKTGATPLLIAAREGFENIAYVLIQNNSEVNTQDRFGQYIDCILQIPVERELQMC